jgi:hypothetical protein
MMDSNLAELGKVEPGIPVRIHSVTLTICDPDLLLTKRIAEHVEPAL